MPYFPSDPELPEALTSLLIGWARGTPRMRLKNPGLPKDWHAVLSVDPTEPNRKPLAGSFWLYHLGRVRMVYAGQYEVVRGGEQPS